MKTVIDQVLEIIQLAREGEIDSDLRSIKHRVEQLKPVFKQDIIDAVEKGRYIINQEGQRAGQMINGLDYFTQKYEQ